MKRIIEELYPNCSEAILRDIRYKIFSEKNFFDLDRFNRIEEGYMSTPEWMRWTD